MDAQENSFQTMSLVEFTGAILAALLVFGIYYDAIDKFDGGNRQVSVILRRSSNSNADTFRWRENRELQGSLVRYQNQALVKRAYFSIKLSPQLFCLLPCVPSQTKEISWYPTHKFP